MGTLPMLRRHAVCIHPCRRGIGARPRLLPGRRAAALVEAPFSHRGASHSLVFAVGVAAVLAPMAVRSHEGFPRGRAWLYLFFAVASHGLLDMATDGGRGIAISWPFSAARYFFPFRPIAVSPIGLRFLSERGLRVMASELLWVRLPAAVVALVSSRSRVRPNRR
jgi:inner membrane protein